ncbi:hypothetical protein B0H11DRAFT_1663994, partial [Mycena galericulata]
ILHATRSIISGSTPLAVISGGTFVPNDLDIYVPATEEDGLLSLLGKDLGFQLEASIPWRSLYRRTTSLQSVRWLTNGGSKKINVMTCAGDSALPAIFEFHSTVVMNFISSHGLYCAYPHLTMAEQGIPSSSYFAETRSQTSRRLLRKYRERGYVIEEKLDDHLSAVGHTCFVHPSCPLTIRTLYDGHGAFMTF